MRSTALIVVVAAVAAGCGVQRCKDGTVLLGIIFGGATADADHVDVTVVVDGNKMTGSFTRQPGARVDTAEIDFRGGYHAGHELQLTVVASRAGVPLGGKSLSFTPNGSCDRFDVSLDATAVDAAVPDAPLTTLDGAVDAAVAVGDAGNAADLSAATDAALAPADLAGDLAPPPLLNCPAPGDPRIAMQAPFATVALQGGNFFSGTGATWQWSITTAHPCTTLGSFPGFTLTSPTLQNASAKFLLSGDYQITMTATVAGQPNTCVWTQHVGAPGLRVELCWDHTGTADLDIHLHQPTNTANWFSTTADCFYANCGAAIGTSLNWGYANGPIGECQAANAGWTTLGHCPNPRLDLDNINTVGSPEAISIDAPNDGQSFRPMVHYYGNTAGNQAIHPIVVAYCDGVAVGTFGQAPQLSGFDKPAGANNGLMWRVADIAASIGTGGLTCTATQLFGDGGSYLVTDNNLAF